MKDPENKDLIRQMKDVLQEYEEPYMEGAWEQFSAKEKGRNMPYWPWAAAAALFLIVGSLWLLTNNQQSEPLQQKIALRRSSVLPEEKKPLKTGPKGQTELSNVKQSTKNIEKEQATVNSGPEAESGRFPAIDVQEPMIAESSLTAQASLSNPAIASAEVRPIEKRQAEAATDKFMNFLIDQGKAVEKGKKSEATAKLKSASKWGFGVEILPTVSEAALNVGAGLTTQYRLSDHFSLGSGISYVELQAGKALTPGVSLLSTRQLQSVDANFRAIDIPLNLVYNINKNLYTAVGVSYFNVLKEDRQNTFVSERQVSAFSTDPVTGIAANTRTFVSETTQEPADETLLNGKSYLGFFNFSVGRKQELFKKYNIFIEPFIKVPVGKLSQQELKMMNGGMKFRLAF
jgi:hypothetical protein